MPLYGNGSLISEVDDVGTGLIILCFQISGVMPKSKHFMNRTVNISPSLLLFITSSGKLSIPEDLLFFIAFIAFTTTSRVMEAFMSNSALLSINIEMLNCLD